jgi:glycosyltransferase involved in cell wall biosynthesis
MQADVSLPLITIIIPVYNVELFIEAAILSALNQTYENLEYVIIDDCGSDSSMQIVQDIVTDHPKGKNMKIISHEKNRGLSVARNTGIEKSNGEFIFFLDSDDEIVPDCIELLYKNIIDYKADVVMGQTKIINARSVHRKNNDFSKREKVDILKDFLLYKYPYSAWNKLYWRRFLNENKIRFAEGIICEDILYNYVIAKNAKRIISIPDETYFYKIRKNSITKSKITYRNIESVLFIIEYIINDWNENRIPMEVKSSLNYFITFLRFNISISLLWGKNKWKDRMEYYKKLNDHHNIAFCADNKMALLLKLPFPLFTLVLIVPYYLYKFWASAG